MKTEEDEYIEPFCRGWFDEQYRFLSGRSSAVFVSRLYNQFSWLVQKESFLKLHAQPEKRLSAALVAHHFSRSLAEDEFARVETLEQRSSDQVALLSQSVQRELRGAVEQKLEHFYQENAGDYLKLRHAEAISAQRLGFASEAACEATLGGYPYEELLAEAANFLNKTDDAYRDVLPYILKKSDPTHAEGGVRKAQWHDLLFAFNLPWMAMAGHFDSKRWLDAITHWYRESGLLLESAQVKLDVEESAGKSQLTLALPRNAPGRVTLFHRPRGGGGAVDALLTLGALGEAQSFVHVTPAAPASARWLRARSVQQAWNSLFSLMLIDENWLRRYLRLSPSTAHDTARLFSFLILALARQEAAKLRYRWASFKANQRSDDPDPRGKNWEEEIDLFDDKFRSCLGVRIPSAWAYPMLVASEQAPFKLQGLALAASMRPFLQSQHDEDYWRNPASARWMKGLFFQGGDQTYSGITELNGLANPTLIGAAGLLLEKLRRW